MKRILLIFTLLLALTVNAQHLSFMGIPLNGNINTFTTKLKSKGFKISPYNKNLAVGTRSFLGTFIGEDANVFIYYNTKTYNVYRAKACIPCNSEERVKSLLNDVFNSLYTKYDCPIYENSEQEGFPSYELYIVKDETQEMTGYIDLYISKEDGLYSWSDDTYVLHIDYIDYENDSKNFREKMNDL